MQHHISSKEWSYEVILEKKYFTKNKNRVVIQKIIGVYRVNMKKLIH